MRYIYLNPLAAIKAASKFEALGFVVVMSADADIIVLTVLEIISTADLGVAV